MKYRQKNSTNAIWEMGFFPNAKANKSIIQTCLNHLIGGLEIIRYNIYFIRNLHFPRGFTEIDPRDQIRYRYIPVLWAYIADYPEQYDF